MILDIICDKSSIIRVFYILNLLKTVIFIIIPVILLIVLLKKLIKTIITNDENYKDLFKESLIKIFITCLIFFIPTLLSIFVNLIDNKTLNNISDCFDKGSVENIKKYSKIEDIERVFKNMENNPNEKNLKEAENALVALYSLASGDEIDDYIYRLSTVNAKINEPNEYNSCINNGGTYYNGICRYKSTTIDTSKYQYVETDSSDDQSTTSSTGSSVTSSKGPVGSNMLYYSFNSTNDYVVVNTKFSVKEYIDVVKKYKLCQVQSDDKVYSDQCLCFAEEHTHALVTGEGKKNPASISGDYYSSSFIKSYDNDNKNLILEKIYGELINNRPVILQVNGNSEGTLRHYVTVIGMKSNVQSGSSLKDTDLLILDSYNGKVRKVNSYGTSRFMITGKACKKKYSGYQIYYLA